MNDNDKNEFNLYSENIVPTIGMKYKKVFRAIKVIALALLCAAVAGAVCGVVISLVNNAISPKKEDATKPQIVFKPDNIVEEPTEDVIGDTEIPTAPPSESEYEKYLSNLNNIAKRSYTSMVTVASVTTTEDIFNSVVENEKISMGVMIFSDETQIYILTQYSTVRAASHIRIEFNNGNTCFAQLVGKDVDTDIAIVKINISDLTEQTYRTLKIAELGNSNQLYTGVPVIAVGNVAGTNFTMNHGIITNFDRNYYCWDAKYMIINTNIYVTEGSFGVLLNTNGQVCGVISTKYSEDSHVLNAYAISNIKLLLQHISNGNDVISLGIMGNEVDNILSNKYSIPKGIYITMFKNNSPAFMAGLRNGDIIVGADGKDILKCEELQNILYSHKPGDVIKLKINRKANNSYKTLEISVTLGVQ